MPHQHIHTDWMLQFGTTTQFCNDAIRRELVKEMCMIQGSCDVSIIKYWFQFQIHIYWQASIYKSLCKQLIWWMPWEHLRIEIKTAKSPAAGEMSSSRGHWAGAGVLVKEKGCGHSQKRRYLTQALARRFFIVMTAGKKVAREVWSKMWEKVATSGGNNRGKGRKTGIVALSLSIGWNGVCW